VADNGRIRARKERRRRRRRRPGGEQEEDRCAPLIISVYI
jgi:hypothetical protein